MFQFTNQLYDWSWNPPIWISDDKRLGYSSGVNITNNNWIISPYNYQFDIEVTQEEGLQVNKLFSNFITSSKYWYMMI
jgi:hypothetical protein